MQSNTDLRCSVPQGDHLVSVDFISKRLDGASQTEVCNLDAAVLIDQKILRLQVSVEDPSLVTEQDALQNLKSVRLISTCYLVKFGKRYLMKV